MWNSAINWKEKWKIFNLTEWFKHPSVRQFVTIIRDYWNQFFKLVSSRLWRTSYSRHTIHSGDIKAPEQTNCPTVCSRKRFDKARDINSIALWWYSETIPEGVGSLEEVGKDADLHVEHS